MRPSAIERNRINVRCHNQPGATSSRNPCKYARARTHIQNALRLPLPAQKVHGRGTHPRGGMRSVAKDPGMTGPSGKLRQCHQMAWDSC